MFTYTIDHEVSLILAQKHHSQDFFQLIDESRDYLNQWMTWADTIQSVEDAEEKIHTQLIEFLEKKGIHFLIFYQNNPVGVLLLKDIDWTIRSAEIGYWLGKDYVGKGIMTRAVKSMLTYGFEDLGLHKMEIWVAEGNSKSRHIPESLGFLQEGAKRDSLLLREQYITLIIYGLLKEEWLSS